MEPDPEDEDDQLNLRHFTPSKSQWKEPLECDQDFVAEEGSRVYVDENGKETSWIEKQAESRRLYNQRQRSGLDESDTDLLDFIQSFREDDEAEILLDFCHGANVESLRADKWNRKETLPKNIWIDERSCRGQVPCSRPNPGPVTAHGAFQRLRKPRFNLELKHPRAGRRPESTKCASCTHPVSSPDMETRPARPAATCTLEPEAQIALAGSAETADLGLFSCQCLHCRPSSDSDPTDADHDTGNGEAEVDADRQLIYIQDLDPWSAYALIGTVPSPHRETLRDALRRHVAAETFVGVEHPVNGLRCLSRFEMHCPFPVLKQGPRVEDQRRGRDGQPLRHVTDVGFLSWDPDPIQEFLYEAHFSFAVVGPNEWVWTAYFLEDRYFYDPKDRYLPEYFEDGLSQEGTPMDPLSDGELEANFPLWSHRHYFLAIVLSRTGQVKRHWQKAASRVWKSIKIYKTKYHSAISRTNEQNGMPHSQDFVRELHKSSSWVRHIRDLTMQLSLGITEVVEAHKFINQQTNIFHDLSEAERRLLAAIEKLVGEFEKLQRQFKNMERYCELYLKDLDISLMLQSNRASDHSKGLADVMVKWMTPIDLATGFFSMNAKVLPRFIPQTSVSFLCILVMFLGLAYSCIHFQAERAAASLGVARQKIMAATPSLRIARRRGLEDLETGEGEQHV